MVGTELWKEDYLNSREGFYDLDLRRMLVYGLLDRLPDHKESILDLGCSNGKDLLEFQKMYGRAVGLDSSETYVEEARRKGLEAQLGDIARVDEIFEREEFDTIHSAYAFHLLDTDSMEEFFQRSSSLLKSGGFFLGIAPNLTLMNGNQRQFVSNPLNGNSLSITYDLFGDREEMKRIPVTGVSYWTPEDIVSAMQNSGMKVSTMTFDDGGISSSNYSCSQTEREEPEFHDSILYLGRKSL